MPDVYSREVRSRVMSRIRKRDTSPEIVVRRFLHKVGCRFRLHRQDLPGVPDIVLAKHRTVIFVHGCFWHQHKCSLGKVPKSNVGYWRPKLRRNQQRDKEHVKALRELGWQVIVIWECQTRSAQRLEQILRARLGKKAPALRAQRRSRV